MEIKIDFLTAGCNNETGVFDVSDGHILYASGKNVLITQITHKRGITCALPFAPSGRVHACQWIRLNNDLKFWAALVASDDGYLRIYRHRNEENGPISIDKSQYWTLENKFSLNGPVMLASWYQSGNSFITAAATAKGEIHFINQNRSTSHPVYTFHPKKVTALAIGILPDSCEEPFIIVALSDASIRILVRAEDKSSEKCIETLIIPSGHQNWITSLSLGCPPSNNNNNNKTLQVLSSSLDKSIRVWKLELAAPSDSQVLLSELVPQKNTFKVNKVNYQFVADSIALGHQNAVYFARFFLNPESGHLDILSGSSDRSLIVWRRGFGDAWRSALQLGDLNGSLGTIGTDHTFAFYGGAIVNENWIIAAASTGSILFWKRENSTENACETGNTTVTTRNDSYITQWIPQSPITGHTDRVESISWGPPSISKSNNASTFLVSSSKDQSTRIFAQDTSLAFREIARPQIHGYDIKCSAIAAYDGVNSSVTTFELVSGADEKVLRVFQAPQQFYRKLGMQFDESIPQSAELPALGLSNKASNENTSSASSENEGDLVRDSLWPEIDKLYGHNQEISSVAVCPSGNFLASAAKSHLAADAALRIWKRSESKWLPSHVIPAHNLTVSRLVFAPNSHLLLSVSRDRNLCLVDPDTGNILCRHEAHSRIIFAADWFNDQAFLTGSRDKTVKFWKINSDASVLLSQTIPFPQGVTALAVRDSLMAVGDEIGNVFIYKYNEDNQENWKSLASISGGGGMGPADAISDLKWNFNASPTNHNHFQLAIASADNSIRIISLYL
jgi:elongator complex protein 2